MDRFAPSQKLRLIFNNAQRNRVGLIYIHSLDEEANTIHLKQNEWNYRTIELDSMTVNGNHELHSIEMYDQPRPGFKTIHIPYINNRTTKDFIKRVFSTMGWAEKIEVDIIENHHKKAFVHFQQTTPEFERSFDYLWSRKDASIRITYKQPWYWTLLKVDDIMVESYYGKGIVINFDSDSEEEEEEEEEEADEEIGILNDGGDH